MPEYTAISFAPVQGFIEKSRKLRDLYGASLILSFLSSKLVQKAESLGLEVISPGLPNAPEGMPNRILIKGKFERNHVQNTLLKEWQQVLKICREWIEENLDIPKNQYYWSQTEDQKGKQKGEWERWGSYTWEIFWGYGESVKEAMDDLETRKLKRDWTAINWVGESSSLTGTDAIAWSRLGLEDSNPGRQLTEDEKKELKDFYNRLSRVLEDCPLDKEPEGKFLAPNERLSIPELVKRLVTRKDIAQKLGISELEKGFTEIARRPEEGMETGRWTGWFMGDGDKVGDKIKEISDKRGDEGIKEFSDAIGDWGKKFMEEFPKDKGRVIYAGGDDFLGVLYTDKSQKPLKSLDALDWLMGLPKEWEKHGRDITLSVGFIWAAPSVPQRDILQHCREAEKRAKNLGRDRVTIRVVFNSGQYVQWTCPWDYLHVLKNYCDRDGKTWGQEPNWTHIYNDWAQLKARHAIRLQEMEGIPIQEQIALALFDLYFNNAGKTFKQERLWDDVAGGNTDMAIVNWINDLIQVGWQLCRNSDI